jgi:hypothetical protein
MDASALPPKSFWLIGFGMFFLLGLLLFGWSLSDNPAAQPIRYNHAVHVASGLACVDCHAGAREQVKASLPGIDTCLVCHAEPLTDSPEEEKIRTFAAAGEEIPWRQVTRVPADIYFSHRRHVALAGLECTDCHGPMETLTEPPRHTFRPVTMDACVGCHEQRNTENDCNRCHR